MGFCFHNLGGLGNCGNVFKTAGKHVSLIRVAPLELFKIPERAAAFDLNGEFDTVL